MNEHRNLFALSLTPQIGPARLQALIQAFGSAERVLETPPSRLVGVKGISEKIAREIHANRYQNAAVELLNTLDKLKISVLTTWDEGFPELLRPIYGAPVILYYCGSILPSDSRAVAIVGTRRPTEYGLTIASRLARELAANDITVVSGLAVGIDAAAHRGALLGGRTIAVLGSSLDRLYPPENRELARKITRSGAVLSEFPPGTKPDAGNFPQRNRIISGLSLGIVIIEAGKKSGALITAEHALEQGREVFVVPGNITSSKHEGSHDLIKQGAKLVQSVDDILEELEPHLGNKHEIRREPEIPIPLSPDEAAVVMQVTNEPIHIDALSLRCNIPTGKLLSMLLGLELKGVIRSLEGKRYVRS